MALPPALAFALRYPALAVGRGRAGFGVAGLVLPAPCWEAAGPKSFPIQRDPPWVWPPGGGTSRVTVPVFLARLRKIISAPAGFPRKAHSIFSSGGREVEGDGLFSTVSGTPGHRNKLKAGSHQPSPWSPFGGACFSALSLWGRWPNVTDTDRALDMAAGTAPKISHPTCSDAFCRTEAIN